MPLPEPYYRDEQTTVYHGDALDILPEITSGSAAAIVTDPPYVLDAGSVSGVRGKVGGWADMMNSAHWFTTWYAHVRRLLADDGSFWSFTSWRTLPVLARSAMSTGLPILSILVWDKQMLGLGSRGLRPSYEMCALMAQPGFTIHDRSIPDVWPHKGRSRKPTGHPAEKPLDLIARILTTAAPAPGSLIIDPFAGSGTTALAARRAGLHCLAIEAEERWCEVIATRASE